jgi:DNA-binding Lrp family transcriptional regulator
MKKGHALDAIDRKILRELQRDGRLSNVELSARIGLSAPPTLRRVQVLEREGFIAGYRAQLDAKKLGYGIQMFAFVGLKSQNEAELKAFEARVAGWPLVREAYAISGDADFVLHLAASDLNELQTFIIATLTAAPNVDNVKTTMIMRISKYEPGVPLA